MHVKLLQSIASATFCYHIGQIVIINDDLAKKWKAAGICEIEKGKEPVSTTQEQVGRIAVEPDEKEIFVPNKKK